MTLSRKNFFRHGFFSLGETLLKSGGALLDIQRAPVSTQNDTNSDSEPIADINSVAMPENQLCLAKNCGCFSCSDCCESGAIMIVPGTGVVIDPQLCTGCGMCRHICPVTPKAITMQLRQT